MLYIAAIHFSLKFRKLYWIISSFMMQKIKAPNLIFPILIEEETLSTNFHAAKNLFPRPHRSNLSPRTVFSRLLKYSRITLFTKRVLLCQFYKANFTMKRIISLEIRVTCCSPNLYRITCVREKSESTKLVASSTNQQIIVN